MERRAHSRFDVNYKVLIPGNGSYLESRTVNLSKSGLQVKVDGVHSLESPEFTLLIRVPGKPASLAVKARVVWSETAEDFMRLGFRFIHLGQSDALLLEEIINEVRAS